MRLEARIRLSGSPAARPACERGHVARVRAAQPSYLGVLIGARSVGPNESAKGPRAPGVWVRVSSAGEVSIVSLKETRAPLAVSRPVAGFDFGAFHTLVVERRGPILQVWLDHATVRFRIGAAPGESESVVMPEDALGWCGCGDSLRAEHAALWDRPARSQRGRNGASGRGNTPTVRRAKAGLSIFVPCVTVYKHRSAAVSEPRL